MTEFEMDRNAALELMPEDGAARLFGDATAHPRLGRGAPCAELYLIVEDPAAFQSRAI